MEHPARALPEPQKIDYLLAVAQLVWTDGVVAEAEMQRLGEVCQALNLSDAARESLIAAAAAPEAERARAAVAWIRKDVALRFSLLGDALLIAFADGILAAPEAEEIALLARGLGVEREQAIAMARYVEGLLRAPSGKTDPALHALSQKLEDALGVTDPAAAAAAAAPARRSWFRRLLGGFGPRGG